jgi:beta-hydroxylase
MDVWLAVKLAAFGGFVASVLFVHCRGQEKLSFRRQITDHSTFLAPYNVLVYLFSGVPHRPIVDAADVPEVARFRDNWETIRDEARRLYDAGYVRASDRHDDLGFNSFFRKGWKRFYLKWYGAPLPSARELCPKAVELVESTPTVHGAMFALMEPHGKVGDHRDPFAGSVRDLVFDETYIHWFENRTDQPRIIFFADVERPIRNPVMRAVNRWVIRRIVGLSATKNLDGEPVGFANRVFEVLYRIRPALRRFKKANRTAYYTAKYAAIAGGLYLLLFAGSSAFG